MRTRQHHHRRLLRVANADERQRRYQKRLNGSLASGFQPVSNIPYAFSLSGISADRPWHRPVGRSAPPCGPPQRDGVRTATSGWRA